MNKKELEAFAKEAAKGIKTPEDLNGLNVRTIQRIEKGDSVGLETLKSLAAVFEVDVNDLKNHNLKQHQLLNAQELSEPPPTLEKKKP